MLKPTNASSPGLQWLRRGAMAAALAAMVASAGCNSEKPAPPPQVTTDPNTGTPAPPGTGAGYGSHVKQSPTTPSGK
jgi:hypothetical protein